MKQEDIIAGMKKHKFQARQLPAYSTVIPFERVVRAIKQAYEEGLKQNKENEVHNN